MLELLGALTLFGASIWMILFLGIFALIAAVSLANESGLGSLISFVLSMIGLSVFFDVPVWDLVSTNFGWILVFGIGFILIGIAFTALWEFPVKMQERYGDRIKSDLKEWRRSHDGEPDESFYTSRYWNKMHPAKHVDLITRSIFNWPLILLVELLHRPFVWLWKTTYDLVSGMFERIAIRVAKSAVSSSDKD